MASVTLTLERLTAATDQLLGEVSGLGEADVREPSLLPGWTRGHVLSHPGPQRRGRYPLLGWARIGIPSYQAPGPLPPVPSVYMA